MTIYNSNYTQKCSKLLQWKMCKVFNVWPKKVQRSYLSWNWRVMQNLKKNWLAVWKMTLGICKFSPEQFKVSKLGFWWDPSIQSRKSLIHRGVMCHDIMMQNLKKNWLVISKLTWAIWWVLPRALESFKNFHFNVLLLSKVYIV